MIMLDFMMIFRTSFKNYSYKHSLLNLFSGKLLVLKVTVLECVCDSFVFLKHLYFFCFKYVFNFVIISASFNTHYTLTEL